MKVIRVFNAQPVKISHSKSLLTCKQARWPPFFISWMLIVPSFKKSLIEEQVQGGYLKVKHGIWKQNTTLRKPFSSWISIEKSNSGSHGFLCFTSFRKSREGFAKLQLFTKALCRSFFHFWLSISLLPSPFPAILFSRLARVIFCELVYRVGDFGLGLDIEKRLACTFCSCILVFFTYFQYGV